MVKMKLECSKHPTYQALRPPKGWSRNDGQNKACMACSEIYEFVVEPDAKPNTWPAKVGGVVYKSFRDDSELVTRRTR